MANNSQVLTCEQRYAQNATNLGPTSVHERYPPHLFLHMFMPGTLTVVRLFMITWLTVGLFGNGLSLAIWTTKHQRRKSTSAIYLSALALADLILILALVNYHIERYWGLRGITTVAGLCQLYQCLTIFAQYYSTVLVFGFTVERYLAVCFPFKRHKLCSAKRAVLAITILLLICTVPMVFQAVLWTFEDGYCHMKSGWIRDSRVQAVLTGQEIIFSLIVPSAALIFNLLLLREMRRLVRSTAVPTPTNARPSIANGSKRGSIWQKTAQSLSAYKRSHSQSGGDSNQIDDNASSEDNQSQESSNFVATTIMLIILSFYLIACAVPPGVVYLAQFTWVQPDDCLSDKAVYNDSRWSIFLSQLQSKELIDVLCASHYALNFFIYVLTSKGFREHAFWILSCRIGKLRSLSRPTGDGLTFPRRTGPRKMKSSALDEEQTLVTDSQKSGTTVYQDNHNTNGTR